VRSERHNPTCVVPHRYKVRATADLSWPAAASHVPQRMERSPATNSYCTKANVRQTIKSIDFISQFLTSDKICGVTQKLDDFTGT